VISVLIGAFACSILIRPDSIIQDTERPDGRHRPEPKSNTKFRTEGRAENVADGEIREAWEEIKMCSRLVTSNFKNLCQATEL
jgi:hypothetical protein